MFSSGKKDKEKDKGGGSSNTLWSVQTRLSKSFQRAGEMITGIGA
jgi:hypothetical protein